jgi:hypothetical protein
MSSITLEVVIYVGCWSIESASETLILQSVNCDGPNEVFVHLQGFP